MWEHNRCTAVTLAIGGNGSKIAYVSHSAWCAPKLMLFTKCVCTPRLTPVPHYFARCPVLVFRGIVALNAGMGVSREGLKDLWRIRGNSTKHGLSNTDRVA